MICYIFGGSASGKSEYAEELAVSRGENLCSGGDAAGAIPLLYIATMKNDSAEAAARIQRHRRQRRGRGFQLFEAESLAALESAPAARTILFDCVSNFTANVMFSEEFDRLQRVETMDSFCWSLAKRIADSILGLSHRCVDLILVSDAVFSDGQTYDFLTEAYIRVLGIVGTLIAGESDEVTEVIFGLPYRIK